MAQNILNPGTSRVVYSDDARVIAGGERIRDVTLDGTTRRAVQRGDLILENDTEQDEPRQDEQAAEPEQDAGAAPGEPAPEDGH